MVPASECSSEVPKTPILPRPEPPRPARKYLSQAQAQSSPPASEATAPAVPDDAVRAETEKRWGDAERLYRESLAKEPNRVDLLLRLADILGIQNKPVEAAQTLARAADLRSDGAALQLRASEAFGAADRPADAPRYNDVALAVRPGGQTLLR